MNFKVGDRVELTKEFQYVDYGAARFLEVGDKGTVVSELKHSVIEVKFDVLGRFFVSPTNIAKIDE